MAERRSIHAMDVKSAKLTGYVRNAGQPVAGATVSLYQDKTIGWDTSDGNGQYSIGGLQLRQTYVLKIAIGDGIQEVGQVTITEMQTRQDISLPLGGST